VRENKVMRAGEDNWHVSKNIEETVKITQMKHYKKSKKKTFGIIM